MVSFYFKICYTACKSRAHRGNRRKEDTTMIVYFSGTGNSRFCAQFLAHALNDTCFDVFSLIRQGIALELTSEKPWVFVAPTYGWQLPRIFSDLIKTG